MLIDPFELTRELQQQSPEKKTAKDSNNDPFGFDQKDGLGDFLDGASKAGSPTSQQRAAGFINRIVDTQKLDDESPSL